MTQSPLIIGPDEGVSLPLGQSRLTIKLTAADTAGRLALLDYAVAPHFRAPQKLPWRTRETQAVYILDGRIRFSFCDQVVEAVSGSVIYLPEYCAYTWENPSKEPSRILYLYTPGGLEQLFFDLQKIFQEHPDLSPADTAPFVAELWEKYGIEM